MNGKRTAVHGVDPTKLLEKIVRDRIVDSVYWKEQCFALTEETLAERACQLQYVGGLYGNQRPSPFLCLLYKLLELQPESAVVEAFIQQEEHKYLRVLAAFYWRIIAPARGVYVRLEPLLQDFRKLRCRSSNGYFLTHVDEVMDELLHSERVFDVILPHMTKRELLEKMGNLPSYVSPLEAEISDSQDESS